MGKKYTILFLFFLWPFMAFPQDIFKIKGGKDKYSMSFQQINNLIVIPVEINEKKLNFILDTGIDKTILLNLKFSDSLELRNIEEIIINGLGEGEPLTAYKSKKNHTKIGNIINFDHLIYAVMGSDFDLSAKMGMDINGIIGGDLLHDFIVHINFSKKKLVFYDPDKYSYKKCKKCEEFPLLFYNRKPFIIAQVEDENQQKFDVKLLIDSGGGDALWLFNTSSPKIKIPNKNFDDYLGRGLSGEIHGKRSRIPKFSLGSFTFENVNVAYPDSTSILAAHKHKERNGTIGAEIIRRFNIILDYRKESIILMKNKRAFKKPFLYNKSGIEIFYGGEILIKNPKNKETGFRVDKEQNKIYTDILNYFDYVYMPSFEIALLRENSEAKNAGLQVGDIILEINDKSVYDKNIEEIIYILSGNEGGKIKMLIERKGLKIVYRFKLRSLL
ncbi:MAG: aspartyl protease family protein [Bacteroidota bacterium]